jgi:disulfide bond formation protein DsbB
MRLNPRLIESISIWVMVLGIAALCQPWNLFFHRYGVLIILIGLVGFIFFSHIPSPERSERSESADG